MKRLSAVAVVAGAIAAVGISAPAAHAALPSVTSGTGCGYYDRSGSITMSGLSRTVVTLADGTRIIHCRGLAFGPGSTETFSTFPGCDEYSQTIFPNGYVTSRCVVYA